MGDDAKQPQKPSQLWAPWYYFTIFYKNTCQNLSLSLLVNISHCLSLLSFIIYLSIDLSITIYLFIYHHWMPWWCPTIWDAMMVSEKNLLWMPWWCPAIEMPWWCLKIGCRDGVHKLRCRDGVLRNAVDAVMVSHNLRCRDGVLRNAVDAVMVSHNLRCRDGV